MRNETGTDIFEWIDHLVLGPGQAEALRAVGYVEERVEAPAGTTVFWQPQAMMPRVLLRADGGRDGGPAVVAIRPELLADFLTAHELPA
ncbi:MAG: hypothetical protein EXS33_04075, partial [Pedosphaera sp.]|nr:hypothetical protein [Pedosphaera sp.]